MNRMFTTCPNCTLNLAVTAADLRVGQGYVRCGRCERVFNALLSLTEDIDEERQSGLAATGTTSVPALPETAFEAAPQPEPEAEPEAQAEADQSADEVETLATGTFETIVLEGDSYLQTEEVIDQAQLDHQVQQIADQIEADDFAHVRAELGVEEHTGENVVMQYSDEHPADEPENAVAGHSSWEHVPEDLLASGEGTARPTHWIWGAAAGLLGLLLAVQFVHHFRQTLVAQPWAEAPLKNLYSIFGVTLEPQWDLAAYDVRQLGGSTMPGEAQRIRLRASVHNKATHAQPPPLLRVTLQDRFGNALATRDIAPQDYLRGQVMPRLKADQRVDAELTLDDPGRQAVGFELDACLPAADRRLHCAGSP